MRRDGLFEVGDAMSRWREEGRARLRWGSGASSKGWTFDGDLALLERQVLESRPGDPRGPAAAPVAAAA